MALNAAAAKELSNLVEVSTKQVKDGAQLAQCAGIEEINQAIAQLDESTQQNAALVEEGAAAAQSLDEQAQSLDELAGRLFYLKITVL